MSDLAALVADNFYIWTRAIERKSGAGRGGGKRISLYGIERLRALVLDLAVRGKLVPQDRSDEPAGELLKRIANSPASFKQRRKSAAGLRQAVSPINLPIGWELVRFDDLANPQAGFAFKSKGFNEIGVGLPLIRIRDVGQPFTGTFYDGEFRDEFVVDSGDYLVSMDGEFRVATWQNGTALLNQRVTRLQFFSGELEQSFVAIALQLELAKLQGVKAYTTVDHLSGKQIAEALIPLPPLAEQQRIVAKVDELMALCDALERESAGAMAAHQVLVEELLATLVNSENAADLAANWARLESHFDTLFTTDASIDALKQTILDLAVRGKLVEQDAGEEPAIKKLKGPQASPPFGIPANWQCVPLQGLGRQVGGGTPSKSRPDFWEGTIPWVSPKDMKRDYLSDAEMSVTETALEGSAVKLLAPESLMFVVRGMILAHSFPVAIAKAPVTINQDMKAIELDQPSMAEYLLRALKGLKPLMLARVERSSHGTCRLDATAYGSFPVPIPPLTEQHRIVAKVDELMALCDALKVGIADAATTQKHLADAITERAAA
ncbi:restriction endonuclease subunit S [Novosphingobium aquae]|uniref:Restriction endonuclease subunit S n=1 Tax=Novosphingobium aquae TaxID=3133435 RepID=A0ABU8SCA7_9SPHN